MEIITKKIEDVIPYEKNPRVISNEAVEKVANSIREFGFKVPIIIDKDGIIVAGHTRLLAAKKLKLKEVPCVIADDLTPEQIKAFRLADNKVSEFSEWDFDLLDTELQDLINIDFDMQSFGFENTIIDYEDGNFGGNEEMSEEDDGLKTPSFCTCPNCGFKFEPITEDEK